MEFVEFLDREMVQLTRFAGVLVGNRHDAHDVLADALLDVGKQWSRISELDHPTAYVRKVIVNRFLADRRSSIAGAPTSPTTTAGWIGLSTTGQRWWRTATCWIGCFANCRRGSAR